MRLGINFTMPHETPEHWGDLLVKEGYRATAFPVNYKTPDHLIDGYVKAAKERDILIAEVGVWNSPHHPDAKIAEQARQDCLEQFRLAEYVKANCCVNVSGAAGDIWYYCYKENYSEDMYKRNVEFVQYLCDTLNPQHTNYALEPMQWMIPDSPQQYAQFLKDVNREHFKVHMDIWNFITNPYWYTHQEELIKDAFELLGDQIVSCHIKDVHLDVGTTVAIREVEIGTGEGNHACYLEQISRLNPDVPVLIEHLDRFEQYNAALNYLKEKYGKIIGK